MPDATAIQPENMIGSFELLERVKACASKIISETQESPSVDLDTIATALNPNSIVSENTIKFEREHKPQGLSAERIDPIQVKTNLVDKVSISTLNPRDESVSVNSSKALAEKMIVQHKTADEFDMPEQSILSSIESSLTTDIDVITLLKKNGIPYIDKRSNGGALWIIGGKELSPIVKQCQNIGVKFSFKENGGKVTRGKCGWWTR